MTPVRSNFYFLSDTDNTNIVVLDPTYIKVGDKFEYEYKNYTVTAHREGSFFEIDQKITCNMGDMIEVTHKKHDKNRRTN